MITFTGKGIVWDADKNCILCIFKNGKFETENVRTAKLLKNAGYDYEGEIFDENSLNLTKEQIMLALDEKGVEYNKKANKAELIELLNQSEVEVGSCN